MNYRYLLLSLLLLVAGLAKAQKAQRTFVPDQPYDQYELKTGTDTVTFYLSVAAPGKKLPLIVYVQGSGNSSLFSRQGQRIVPTAGHFTWFEAAPEKYRILIVEKPGVRYLQTGESKRFDRSFSLENWCARLTTAIDYVVKNENIDTKKILVAGHSEGGVAAARVARSLKSVVSHVAVMAGEGPSQLYSLYKFAEDGTFFNTPEHHLPEASQRTAYVEQQWANILADPYNTDKKFWGFTYLRWSSFLNTSVIDELSAYDGRVLLVQGTADKAVYPESAVVAYTALRSKGRNVTLELIPGADHSFYIGAKPQTDGWKETIGNVMQWFDAVP